MRRGKIEMQLDLLKAIFENSEARITYLQHKSNMMRPTFLRMLEEMARSGLFIKESRFYFLTDKGRQAIRLYNELSKLIDEKPISVPED